MQTVRGEGWITPVLVGGTGTSLRGGAVDNSDSVKAVLGAILAHSFDGIIVVDERGNIVSFSKASERIFGYRSEEVIGWNIVLLMAESQREGYSVALARYFRTGETRISGPGRQVLGQRKDGTTFSMELAVTDAGRQDPHRLFVGIVRCPCERCSHRDGPHTRSHPLHSLRLEGSPQ